MKGFDERFADFPDYIIGITRQIWEERELASLHRFYARDIVVRSPEAVITGNQGVIAATMATLAEFPDRELLGEDVIWCGDPSQGMLSSHRILSRASHLGSGVYGDATGKKIEYRIIADCHALNNCIDDEWLIRDQSAIVRQLGLTPEEFARRTILRERETGRSQPPLNEKNDIEGPYRKKGNDNEWGARLADILTRIMGADFSAIPKEYDRACELAYPGGVLARSHDGADRFWMGLRASFPAATFEIHHVIGLEEASMPARAAVRWSLSGGHDGWGGFGAPTGAEVYILGITHAEFKAVGSQPRLRREWTLIDETAIWKQILLSTGVGLEATG
ncbi:nuclear transport factor 2 family protein [Thioalkalivibrio sp. HK1]|uniref:nuclear transport factor 2 family protein n=1 Tax=Thioalkalivibrio sp. HK1 TaxID=1469245 RepID=UPI00046F5A67|nr:ester cyclase [Thioalkalivibrio sp. HK1]